MVSFTIVIATVAALTGQVLGQPDSMPMPSTCNTGETYCGFHLLNNGNSMSPFLAMAPPGAGKQPLRPPSPPREQKLTNPIKKKTAFQFWSEEIRKAQPGLEEGRRAQAIYRCKTGVDKLEYIDYCPRTGQRCEPNSSGLCGPATPFPNDCCATR